MNTYTQLTYEQRCHIQVLKKTGLSQQAIADAIGVDQSTISRELGRNSGLRGYRQAQAQRKAKDRRTQAQKATKMTAPTVKLIESKLGEKWSPEQVSGWLRETRDVQISYETIYLHV